MLFKLCQHCCQHVSSHNVGLGLGQVWFLFGGAAAVSQWVKPCYNLITKDHRWFTVIHNSSTVQQKHSTFQAQMHPMASSFFPFLQAWRTVSKKAHGKQLENGIIMQIKSTCLVLKHKSKSSVKVPKQSWRPSETDFKIKVPSLYDF